MEVVKAWELVNAFKVSCSKVVIKKVGGGYIEYTHDDENKFVFAFEVVDDKLVLFTTLDTVVLPSKITEYEEQKLDLLWLNMHWLGVNEFEVIDATTAEAENYGVLGFGEIVENELSKMQPVACGQPKRKSVMQPWIIITIQRRRCK